MSLLVPDVGERKFLNVAINGVANEDLTLKLYKNNYTPVEGSVAGDFTEATFTGYAAVTLARGSWTVATVAGLTTAAYAQQAFTSSADQTLENEYGYFVVGASSGVLWWAERFTGGPFPIQFNGDQINVTPKINAD